MMMEEGNEKSRYRLFEQLSGAEALVENGIGNWRESTTICTTCTHAHYMRQRAKNRGTTYCRVIAMEVPGDLEVCNNHETVTKLSLYDMTQMATLIEIKNRAGFAVPEKEGEQ